MCPNPPRATQAERRRVVLHAGCTRAQKCFPCIPPGAQAWKASALWRLAENRKSLIGNHLAQMTRSAFDARKLAFLVRVRAAVESLLAARNVGRRRTGGRVSPRPGAGLDGGRVSVARRGRDGCRMRKGGGLGRPGNELP